MNRLIDTAMIAALFCTVGYIAHAIQKDHKPDCPIIQGNKHIVLEMTKDGGFKCWYEQRTTGLVLARR